MKNNLYRWLYYLSIPIFVVNLWVLFSVIIYALIAESYGHYSFTETILHPQHIFIFIFSVLGILLFIKETVNRISKKLNSTKFILATLIILMIAPTILYGGSVLRYTNYVNNTNREKELIENNSDILEKILFDESFDGASIPNIDELLAIKNKYYKLEDKLKLMIEVSPEKTMEYIENTISTNNFETNAWMMSYLPSIIAASPDSIVRICKIRESITEIEKDEKRSSQARLEARGNRLSDKCDL